MAWVNSKNAEALKDSVQAKYPGTQTIYTVGDLDHQSGSSDHNPDDDSRYRTDQTDSDSKQEVRAVDIMVSSTFSPAQAAVLVKMILDNNKARTYYVIYNKKIYRSRNGWKTENYTGSDPHTNHVHVSTLAAQDENSTPWNLSLASEDEVTPADITAIKTAILTHNLTPSSTPTTVGQCLLDAHRIWELMPDTAKAAAASAARTDGLLGMTDVVTSWSTVNPKGTQNNALADAVNSLLGSATADAARDEELKALVSQYNDGGVTAEEVMTKLGELLTKGTTEG